MTTIMDSYICIDGINFFTIAYQSTALVSADIYNAKYMFEITSVLGSYCGNAYNITSDGRLELLHIRNRTSKRVPKNRIFLDKFSGIIDVRYDTSNYIINYIKKLTFINGTLSDTKFIFCLYAKASGKISELQDKEHFDYPDSYKPPPNSYFSMWFLELVWSPLHLLALIIATLLYFFTEPPYMSSYSILCALYLFLLYRLWISFLGDRELMLFNEKIREGLSGSITAQLELAEHYEKRGSRGSLWWLEYAASKSAVANEKLGNYFNGENNDKLRCIDASLKYYIKARELLIHEDLKSDNHHALKIDKVESMINDSKNRFLRASVEKSITNLEQEKNERAIGILKEINERNRVKREIEAALAKKKIEGIFLNFKNNADKGDTDAMISLAQCYFDGYGVKPDVDLGMKYLNKAGTSEALYEQAQIYLNGKYGVPIDSVWGSELLGMAISNGYKVTGADEI